MHTFQFRPRWLAGLAQTLFAGRIRSEAQHPISRILIRLYDPVLVWVLRRKWIFIGTAMLMIVVTIPVYQKLGSEFMPPLEEGSILYMPSTMPGISITEAQRLLEKKNKLDEEDDDEEECEDSIPDMILNHVRSLNKELDVMPILDICSKFDLSVTNENLRKSWLSILTHFSRSLLLSFLIV